MLDIKNLTAAIDGKTILNNFSLHVPAGQVHAIMGPNGAGKSTLANVIAGRAGYTITSGSVEFNGVDILAKTPEERAVMGLFLAFQYPVEIAGVTNTTFLKAAVNAQRKARGEAEMDALAFTKMLRATVAELGLSDDFMKRGVNVGFSGGEKKRNEMLQMALLQPTLAVLDETDSGLDIDALRAVGDGVTKLRSPERSFILITHYQRLLDYIVPDRVHVMVGGRIVQSGDASLARDLERDGYKPYEVASSPFAKASGDK